MIDKKVLMIISQNKFCDEEYISSRQTLEKFGIGCEVASSTLCPAIGLDGTIVIPDFQIKNLDTSVYNALLLVGGVGCREYWHNELIHTLLYNAHSNGKLLCAICLAPVILANAGLLRGKRATAHPSASDYLKLKGVKYTSRPVEHEKNIITANGPEGTKNFANKINDLLECHTTH
ncbi:MAG: DJ-1/PfpI family protein [Ignavibacteria bacterium]|nr:DJ-1/PfpI family protein [Ignavibacteria bacterium]MBT8384016.1 DJ-1/PfpI family protein [Ignavibacteria bacterium]MBT8391954.1 DJ-1/PfpI family protein [Ignavibacteria bacterium]NNJ52183.1 DJ-1 family protein [Ignavibacteriaceae bacterium]NNL21774.1 DJ-1 family protein [Ignavibacteriaceae bacterium]